MRPKSLLVGIAFTGAFACGSPAGPEPKSPQPPPTSETNGPPSPPTSPPTNTPMLTPTSPPTTTPMSPPPSTTPPSTQPTSSAPTSKGASGDERIAAVKSAMDAAEIEEARLAEQRTANARVRDFAAGLLAEHQRATERQAELMDRLAMAPVENEESARIRAEAQKDLEALKAKGGAEFDEAFLDMQVATQHKMLDRIHDELIPKIQNEALKAELVSSVPAATADVNEVYDIRRDLAAHPVQARARGQ